MNDPISCFDGIEICLLARHQFQSDCVRNEIIGPEPERTIPRSHEVIFIFDVITIPNQSDWPKKNKRRTALKKHEKITSL